MDKYIYSTKRELGEAAASYGAREIQNAIEERGTANIILATGASQFEMLESLVKQNIDWSRVIVFHLDEYIGLPMDHPASFRRYLKKRFVDKVKDIGKFHYINADINAPEKECARIGKIIKDVIIDVAFIGIGENGHIAFNDPPADFEIEDPYIVVELDEPCRRQQLGEGWFESFDDVPKKAISMSIRQVLKSTNLVVTVPDERKAEAVKCAIEGEVTPMCPASILNEHVNCALFLDKGSSSLLQV